MNAQLFALSLDEDAESLYRRILRNAPSELGAHAARLGWVRTRAVAALDVLIERELVRVTDDDVVRPEHPRLALERLIDREERRLDQRRQELSASRSVIPSFLADHRLGLANPPVSHPAWEVVASEASAGMVEHLFRSTTGPVRQMTLSIDTGPGTQPEVIESTLAGLPRFNRGLRTIYSQERLQDRGWRRWQEMFAAAGEVQRLHAEVPTEFAIFGSAAVVAQERWGDVASDYVVIRDAMLIDAFDALFESYWLRSVPVHVPGADDYDQALIQCLALGMKDEAIARHLGMSLRTTRRRIATLMETLGAETRFQLGAQAAARGLL